MACTLMRRPDIVSASRSTCMLGAWVSCTTRALVMTGTPEASARASSSPITSLPRESPSLARYSRTWREPGRVSDASRSQPIDWSHCTAARESSISSSSSSALMVRPRRRISASKACFSARISRLASSDHCLPRWSSTAVMASSARMLLPPTMRIFSSTSTRAPAWAAVTAAVNPAAPAPTTATSQ